MEAATPAAIEDSPARSAVTEEPAQAEPTPPHPTTDEQLPAAVSGFAEATGTSLSWWPFAVLLFAWLLLAGASVYLLADASAELPARFHPEYRWLVLSGLALAVLSPLVSLGVWLVARTRREPGARHGLLAASMVRGSVTAFFGVILWIVALYVLDLRAFGGLPW